MTAAIRIRNLTQHFDDLIALDPPGNRRDGPGGDLVIISLRNADHHISSIVTILNGHDVPISSLAINKSTLEDVFLSLTGKTIREQDADSHKQMQSRVRMHRKMEGH